MRKKRDYESVLAIVLGLAFLTMTLLVANIVWKDEQNENVVISENVLSASPNSNDILKFILPTSGSLST